MAIHKATLPPKAGYVEVEINGARVYKCIATGEIMPNDALLKTPDEKIVSLEFSSTLHDAQIKATDDRADFLEECLVEMATILYAE